MKTIRANFTSVAKLCCDTCDLDEYLIFDQHKHYHEDEEKMTHVFSFIDKNKLNRREKRKRVKFVLKNFNKIQNGLEPSFSGLLVRYNQLTELISVLQGEALDVGIITQEDLSDIASTKTIPIKIINEEKWPEAVFLRTSDDLVFSSDIDKVEDGIRMLDFSFSWAIPEKYTKKEIRKWARSYIKGESKHLFQDYEGFLYKQDFINLLKTLIFVVDHIKIDNAKGMILNESYFEL